MSSPVPNMDAAAAVGKDVVEEEAKVDEADYCSARISAAITVAHWYIGHDRTVDADFARGVLVPLLVLFNVCAASRIRLIPYGMCDINKHLTRAGRFPSRADISQAFATAAQNDVSAPPLSATTRSATPATPLSATPATPLSAAPSVGTTDPWSMFVRRMCSAYAMYRSSCAIEFRAAAARVPRSGASYFMYNLKLAYEFVGSTASSCRRRVVHRLLYSPNNPPPEPGSFETAIAYVNRADPAFDAASW
eukprot:1556403-Pleurochrysis_carterae.AAC.1